MKDLTRKEERSPGRQFLPLKLPLWTKIHNTSPDRTPPAAPPQMPSDCLKVWWRPELWRATETVTWKTECLLGKITSMKQDCLVPKLCPTLLWSHGRLPTRVLCPWDFPGKNTGVGCHFLLQGTFLTQWSNPGLLQCRWILYQLSHKGSPRILERVACPFSSRSSRPRNQTGVSCIAGSFFIDWAIREAQSPKCVKDQHLLWTVTHEFSSDLKKLRIAVFGSTVICLTHCLK